MSNKSSKSRRSEYNGKPSLENDSHVAIRRKSVSIRELAEFARAKSTETVKSIKDDENNRCPTLSSGISIHDKIRLEALHQGIFQNKLSMQNSKGKTVKQNRQRRFLYNWQNFDIDKAALGDEMGEASQKRSFEKAVESFGLKKKVESAPQLGAARSSSRLSDVKPRRHSFHAEGDSSKARSSARSSSKNSRARTPTR